MNNGWPLRTLLTAAILLYNGLTFAQAPAKNIVLTDDYRKHFDGRQVQGSIIIHDQANNTTYYYDEARSRTRFSPASTFKIFNSLVGLETGVIPDTSYVIQWDGVKRGNYPPWHRANSLQSAFRYSVVWYYQELARRVGAERMQKHIAAAGYGNQDTGATIDGFWLADYGGRLRISPAEQITFLRKLYQEELPFSSRSQQLVKEIMLAETKDNYRLYAKTGMYSENEKAFGWYVGWFETGANVYFFATHIEAKDFATILKGARQGVTFDMMRDLEFIE